MDVLGGVTGFFKRNPEKTETDNLVFRMHYKFTTALLIVFSGMVAAKQYIGDPIDCITRDDIPNYMLDAFCWIHTTYSMNESWDKKVGEEVAYPGLGPTRNGGKKVYHAYYQWVCLVLALQAIMFYLPHYFWKIAEGGKIAKLKIDLNNPVLTQEQKDGSRNLLVDYFDRNSSQAHNSYFYIFVALEITNFIHVIGQMFLVDRFLGGEFMKYGTKVLSFTQYDWKARDDPMKRVFPRLTKCTFHRYGPSGDVTRHDAMCILPINILNEKIYVILWVWLVILAIFSGLILVFRAVNIISRRARQIFLKSRYSQIDAEIFWKILKNYNFGDFMVISLLGKNMDPLNYKEFIEALAKQIEAKRAFKVPIDDSTLTKV